MVKAGQGLAIDKTGTAVAQRRRIYRTRPALVDTSLHARTAKWLFYTNRDP